MKKLEIPFSRIIWGEDEARNDDLLNHYFVEFPGYKDVLNGKKRYVIGRKGTGKSAILQNIRLKANENPEIFYCDVSLRDFPLNDFKALGDRSFQDKSKYVSAWKFLLLTEIANLILQDCSIEDSETLNTIKEFLELNFPSSISITGTIQVLRRNENKITINNRGIGFGLTKGIENTQFAQIHYNKAVQVLENLIGKIQTESFFYILIDELDEGYRANNSNLSMVILSLLRASEELYASFRRMGIRCVPIIALRSDIFDNLEDNDLNKLDDYVLRLSWTTDVNSPWSLKNIVEKRIAATIFEMYPELNITDHWSFVANESSAPKGLWQYLCVLTFSRPRDIIKLLKYCSEAASSNKLTFDVVQSVENKYSDWFFREFRDEVQSFLPCWKGALNCISEIALGKAETKQLLNKFDENEEVKNWCSANNKTSLDIIKILFNYSVIGCINANGRWIFKYKDDYFDFMDSYPYYCVHFGFCRKLRIHRTYDSMILSAYSNYQ